ncbi:hypothetical protein U0070_027537, partial [Myodes glareolus]
MHHSRNQSTGVFFVFLEFSEYPNLQVPLFLVFLIIYTITVLENLGMILVIRINAKLHTPMYFFLSHVSFIDLCYTTVIVPKLLDLLIMIDRSMFIKGCIVQFYFGCACLVAQIFMLAVMAYDRFVTICNPLLYTVAMSRRPCTFLVSITYLWGGLCATTITYFLLALSYCRSTIINHFCFEYSAILSTACSDSSFTNSTKGALQKTLSTCAPHLTAISLCHGIILLFTVCSNSHCVYSMGISMLNPLIYSLRNKDVKETVKKLI